MAGGGCGGSGGRQRLAGTDGRTDGRGRARARRRSRPGPLRPPPPPPLPAAGLAGRGGRRGLAGGGRRGPGAPRGGPRRPLGLCLADPGARTGGRWPHAGPRTRPVPRTSGLRVEPRVWGASRIPPRPGVPSGALRRWCFGRASIGADFTNPPKGKKERKNQKDKKKNMKVGKALISVPPQWVKWRRGSKTPAVSSTSKSTRTNKAQVSGPKSPRFRLEICLLLPAAPFCLKKNFFLVTCDHVGLQKAVT